MSAATSLTSSQPTSSQASGGAASRQWPDGHPRRKLILLVLCLSLLAGVIDNTVLNTALPTLARVLHAGTSSLQWIVDSYTLCFAALLIPAGALGDRYGRRLSLVAGLCVYALGSLAAAFAPSAGVLIADRVVMGLGAAFVMPATLSILNAVFPPRERPQAIAAWSAVAGVGVIIGPTLGGLLLSHFSWGSVFLVNIPIVAIALGGVFSVVPETADAGKRALDVVGTLLIGGALVAIVDAIIEAPTRGWTATGTLAESALGILTIVLFVWRELRVDDPLIDLRIFSTRALAAASGSVTVTFFALFGSLFVFTQYLQLVHGYSPLSAGVRALPFALATGAASPLSPVLAKRFGNRAIVATGLGLMGLGLLDLSTVQVSTGYPAMALAVAVMGAGMGLVMAPASSTIMTTVPAHQAGAGSAVNDTIREVGGALGVAIVGSLTADLYRSHLTAKLFAATHSRSSCPHRHRIPRCRGWGGKASWRLARRSHSAGGTGQFHDRDGSRHAAGGRGSPSSRPSRPSLSSPTPLPAWPPFRHQPSAS